MPPPSSPVIFLVKNFFIRQLTVWVKAGGGGVSVSSTFMNPYPWLASPSYLYLDCFSFAILEASERQKPSVSVLFLSSHSTDTSKSQGCPMQVCFNLGWTEGAKDCPWPEEWHCGSSEGRRDPENQKEGIKIQVWCPRLLILEDLCQIHTNPRGPTQGLASSRPDS